MQVTCSYQTLCELCDQFDWRLELGRETTMLGTVWCLRATSGNDVLQVQARSATLARAINPLTAAIISELRDADWFHT